MLKLERAIATNKTKSIQTRNNKNYIHELFFLWPNLSFLLVLEIFTQYFLYKLSLGYKNGTEASISVGYNKHQIKYISKVFFVDWANQ